MTQVCKITSILAADMMSNLLKQTECRENEEKQKTRSLDHKEVQDLGLHPGKPVILEHHFKTQRSPSPKTKTSTSLQIGDGSLHLYFQKGKYDH